MVRARLRFVTATGDPFTELCRGFARFHNPPRTGATVSSCIESSRGGAGVEGDDSVRRGK